MKVSKSDRQKARELRLGGVTSGGYYLRRSTGERILMSGRVERPLNKRKK